MKHFAWVVALAFACPAFGQKANDQTQPRQDEGRQQYQKMTGQIFSVDTDANKLVVISGQFGAGGQPGNNDQPDKTEQYTVACTDQTQIWRQTGQQREKMTLEDLHRLSKERARIILRENRENRDST